MRCRVHRGRDEDTGTEVWMKKKGRGRVRERGRKIALKERVAQRNTFLTDGETEGRDGERDSRGGERKSSHKSK